MGTRAVDAIHAPVSESGEYATSSPTRRQYLAARRLATGGTGLVFGPRSGKPFNPPMPACRAWDAAELNGLTPHDCRRTYANLMIATGVNAKPMSTYIGRSSICVTLDRYGHLMPGNEAEADGCSTRRNAGIWSQGWGGDDYLVAPRNGGGTLRG
jgi:hypothetical protein